MILGTTKSQTSLFEQKLFQVDAELLERPEAKMAVIEGTLRAKKSALRTATLLSWLSWPLLLAVFFVSFTHLWEQVARIAPTGVPPVPIPPDWYNSVAAANTGLVDLIALYLVATASIANFAGKNTGRLHWFYLALTGLLNGGFVFRYAPQVNTLAAEYIIFGDVAVAMLLTLMVPVSIFGLEHAKRIVEQVRLPLHTIGGLLPNRDVALSESVTESVSNVSNEGDH